MRALLAHGPRNFQIGDVPDPGTPEGGRLLELEAAGVCAADRMLWRGDGPWHVSWPLIPGHEVLGRDTVTGERLTVQVNVPCGECRWCACGRDNLCPEGAHIGSDVPGAFAERMAIPAAAPVHLIPENLPLRAAVLAEPMACALHAVRRASVQRGDTVAVVGLGAIGTLALHAARIEGSATLLAVVRSPEKAALARGVGADEVFDSGNTPVDVADAVIECSGDPRGAALACDIALPGGRVCLYSVYRSPATLNLNQVTEFKELTITGGHLAPNCFPQAIRLLANAPADQVVTALRPLHDARTALESTDHPRVKEVLVP